MSALLIAKRRGILYFIFMVKIISSDQKKYLDFLRAMTEKEIKARYKFALLGFLWIILNPLLQMIVIGFVFQFFVPVSVDNYFLFLFAGLLPWNFFSMTVTKTTPSIVYERSLIQKAKFPREIIVLAIVFSNLFHFLISLILLILALVADKLFFDGYSFLQISSYILRMLWLIPLVAWLTILTSSVSLITSALNVRYRDVNFVIQAVMPLWFYATPIVYSLNLLPQQLHFLFYLNPITIIIEFFHQVTLSLPPTNLELGLISMVMTVLLMSISWSLFSKESKTFDDWI